MWYQQYSSHLRSLQWIKLFGSHFSRCCCCCFFKPPGQTQDKDLQVHTTNMAPTLVRTYVLSCFIFVSFLRETVILCAKLFFFLSPVSKFDEKPEPGDLIEIFRGNYQHWAVYIGDGFVVHLATPCESSLQTAVCSNTDKPEQAQSTWLVSQ